MKQGIAFLWSILFRICWWWQKPKVDAPRGTDTEFTAEVVRITRILPHPNADRLELARFEIAGQGESAYEVVIQKGTTKPGELMAYFSVDSVLPLSHPEFSFLAERPEGVGKTHYRLRAARLRGVFSQGLLVPCPADAKLGDDMAGVFGVTYHSPPDPPGAPTAATKKPKVQPAPVYSVESLKKVPRLFDEGEEVIATEKIHGCNFRFGWVRRRFLGIPIGWRFVLGSHRCMKGDGATGYYGEDVWLDAARKMGLARATRNHRGLVFYGELYGFTYSGQRLQDLTYDRHPQHGPGLVVFDIWSTRWKCWLPPSGRAGIRADCSLDGPPCVYRGPYHPDVLAMADGKSLIASHIREGIVVESIATWKKAKYVGQGYLLRKEAA